MNNNGAPCLLDVWTGNCLLTRSPQFLIERYFINVKNASQTDWETQGDLWNTTANTSKKSITSHCYTDTKISVEGLLVTCITSHISITVYYNLTWFPLCWQSERPAALYSRRTGGSTWRYVTSSMRQTRGRAANMVPSSSHKLSPSGAHCQTFLTN